MLLHRGARRGAVVWPQPPAEPRAGSVGPGGSGSPTAGRAGLPRPPSPRETERGTCARPQIPGCWLGPERSFSPPVLAERGFLLFPGEKTVGTVG